MDIAVLDECWVEQKRYLRDGLLDGGIWSKQTGLPYCVYGPPRDELMALFSRVVDEIDLTLIGADFPPLNRFFLITMEDLGLKVLIIKHDDDLLQGMALDPTKVNLGLLFNVAIPKALAKVQQAKQQG